MKKLLSVLVAVVMMISCCSIFASAEMSQVAKFYLLNEGLAVPTGTASQPSKNYKFAGSGYISSYTRPTFDETGNAVSGYITSGPDLAKNGIKLQPGQSIVWYVVKWDSSDGWHVDGVITPFCSVLYDANCTDATGSTTDATHYYKGDTATVKDSAFSRNDYDFTGWNTKADGTGESYKPGDQLTSDKLNFGKNMNPVTLYACWKKRAATDEPITEPTKNQVKGSIVCPKKMSVRFEDGTVYYGGESILLEIGKEYKFQMCSNDWDTDTYTDDGHGVCGTVVYTVKVSNRYDERSYDPDTKTFILPKGDPVLRTDVNKCFMAYRYHFKTDYNKQTGIKQVVNTPLESLSVNLPLGSTIRSDAYIAYKQVGSADVFVENNKDMTLSYTDYKWSY